MSISDWAVVRQNIQLPTSKVFARFADVSSALHCLLAHRAARSQERNPCASVVIALAWLFFYKDVLAGPGAVRRVCKTETNIAFNLWDSNQTCEPALGRCETFMINLHKANCIGFGDCSCKL
jgi:hypothetical protein